MAKSFRASSLLRRIARATETRISATLRPTPTHDLPYPLHRFALAAALATPPALIPAAAAAAMSSDEDDLESLEEADPYGQYAAQYGAQYGYAAVAGPLKKKKKKKKDPNAPKRGQSAFFLYSNANRNRIKAENPDARFGDIAKIASSEFKAISADERARWEQLAFEDKQRYLAQMEDYVPPSDSDSEGGGRQRRRKKKKTDPNAPKRNQSSFFLYSNATRADVRAANPEAKFGEIAQIISRHYKALPGEERAHWDERAAEDKERYLRQKQEYDQTGTFS